MIIVLGALTVLWDRKNGHLRPSLVPDKRPWHQRNVVGRGPLGWPFRVREPIWQWGLGGALISSCATGNGTGGG
jgi:hypothetical protein